MMQQGKPHIIIEVCIDVKNGLPACALMKLLISKKDCYISLLKSIYCAKIGTFFYFQSKIVEYAFTISKILFELYKKWFI